tara:strand:- start:2438 stop:3340 length:903 start_codon:yes stop_codon:yes gene_type:complete
MKFKILHHKKEQIKNIFNDKSYELTDDNQATELLVTGSTTNLKKEELTKYPNLKFIVHCCNGTNTIDQGHCKNNNIQIFNSPTANINATAEHTVALILAALRKIPAADKSIREGLWERDLFLGREINESTIGFLGFGRIARLVLEKLSSFKPKKVIAYDPFLSQEQIDQVTPKGLNVKVIKSELDDLLKEAEIISLHLPLLPTTKHMIGKDQFEMMKDKTIIINCSRGGIIDEAVLIEALKSNKIAAAALDVFEGEPQVNPKLFDLDQCIMTPHIASMTAKAQSRMILEAKENFEKHLNQ